VLRLPVERVIMPNMIAKSTGLRRFAGASVYRCFSLPVERVIMPNTIAKSTGLHRFTGAPVTGGESYNAKHDCQKHWVTEVYRCFGLPVERVIMPNTIAKSTGLQRFTGAPVTGGESYNAKHDGQKHWVTEVYRCSGLPVESYNANG